MENPKDIDRIIEYLTDPLLHHDEYFEINELKNELDLHLNEKKKIFDFNLYDFSWENIISGKNIENKEEVYPNCEDFISKQALENLNDSEKFANIVSSANDPKKIISKAAKLSFILHLKKAMKTMIMIFRQMQQDEFVSKFNFDFTKELLSPYRCLKNDQYVEDEHQSSIDHYQFKIEYNFLK